MNDDRQIKELQDRAYALWLRANEEFGHEYSSSDVRIYTFSKLFGAIHSFKLLNRTLKFFDTNEDIADQYIIRSREESQIWSKRNLAPYLKFGYFHYLFSAFESSFRLLKWGLNGCDGDFPTGNISSIYPGIIALLDDQEYWRLFIEGRTEIRNSIHLFGVYNPYGEKPVKFQIDDKPCEKTRGDRVEEVTLDFLIKTTEEYLRLFELLIFKTEIKSIARSVTDPAAPKS
jgi:hypothetical protein